MSLSFWLWPFDCKFRSRKVSQVSKSIKITVNQQSQQCFVLFSSAIDFSPLNISLQVTFKKLCMDLNITNNDF